MTGEVSFESCGKILSKSKQVEKCLFLAIFGLILAIFLVSQQYEFDAIAHKGRYSGVN